MTWRGLFSPTSLPIKSDSYFYYKHMHMHSSIHYICITHYYVYTNRTIINAIDEGEQLITRCRYHNVPKKSKQNKLLRKIF